MLTTHVSVFTLQLSVGLYAFRVAVSSEDAFGEGYVNITVMPGESGGRMAAWLCWSHVLHPDATVV